MFFAVITYYSNLVNFRLFVPSGFRRGLPIFRCHFKHFRNKISFKTEQITDSFFLSFITGKKKTVLSITGIIDPFLLLRVQGPRFRLTFQVLSLPLHN